MPGSWRSMDDQRNKYALADVQSRQAKAESAFFLFSIVVDSQRRHGKLNVTAVASGNREIDYTIAVLPGCSLNGLQQGHMNQKTKFGRLYRTKTREITGSPTAWRRVERRVKGKLVCFHIPRLDWIAIKP